MNAKRNISSLPLSMKLLLVLFAFLGFSYHPLLQLGVVGTVHADFSFLYGVTALFVLSATPSLWRERARLIALPAWWLLLALTAWTALAGLWSPNPTRAALTSTFLLVIFLLVSAVITTMPAALKHQRSLIRAVGFAFGLSCLFALWQLVGDALGVGNEFTLLPTAYQADVFGIARPTAFALEPQFLGSLLLAPFCWSLFYQLKSRRFTRYSAVLGISSVMLIMTISRGALFAAIAAGIILVIAVRPSIRTLGRTVGIGLASIALSAVLVIALATLNQRDTVSGTEALRLTVNHLSLNTIRFDSSNKKTVESKNEASQRTDVPSKREPQGYVSESTQSRLSMSQAAISLWSAAPQTVLFGLGTGGFGATLHSEEPAVKANAVVNNYYLELLTETGLVGFSLFAAFIIAVMYLLIRRKQWLGLALLTAFLIQWSFFSGNANILHIWVFFAVVLSLRATRTIPR